MDQYLDKLGQGSYGTVYKFKRDEKLFAIKVFDGDNFSLGVPSASEMLLAKLFDHPHIIKHEEIMYNPNKGSFKLLMELADGDLSKLLDREQAYIWFLQLCSAVKYLHEANLVHFDIKPANCLIKDGVLKLCDFGFCRFSFVEETNVRPTLACPEVYHLMGDRCREIHPIYDVDTFSYQKADIWSLGETFFLMLTGELLFEEEKAMVEKVKFSKNGRAYLEKFTLQKGEVDLLLSLLHIDMYKRPNIEQVMQHKLFAPLTWPSYAPLIIPSLPCTMRNDHLTNELDKIKGLWGLSWQLIQSTKVLYSHLVEKYPKNRMLLLGACLYLCSKLYHGRDLLIKDVLRFMDERYHETELLFVEKKIFLELKEKCIFSLTN